MTKLNQEVQAEVTDGKTRIAIPTDKYVAARSASGSKTQHNGDPVASALEGQPLEAVYGIASEMLTNTSVDDLKAKYQHLNIGQQRMNLGNRIRGAVNKMDKAVDAKAEGAIAGASYLLTVMESYPRPEVLVKAKTVKAEVAVDGTDESTDEVVGAGEEE